MTTSLAVLDEVVFVTSNRRFLFALDQNSYYTRCGLFIWVRVHPPSICVLTLSQSILFCDFRPQSLIIVLVRLRFIIFLEK